MTYPQILNECNQAHPSQKQNYFNYSEWAEAYPELATAFPPNTVNRIAKRAAIMFDPTKTSVVCCAEDRRIIFDTLVAHLIYLKKNSADGNQISGPISSVSEGSVSLSVDTSAISSKIDPYYAQSRYGQEFWAMTRKYRSTFYIRPIPDPKLRIFP